MELTVEAAEERLSALCGSLNVLHGQMVELVADVVESGVWRLEGIRTVDQWLRWQAGLSPATARHFVELAAARQTHPQLSSLLAKGRSRSTRRRRPSLRRAHCDEVMARLAPLSTVTQIRTEVRAARTTEPWSPPVTTVTTIGGIPVSVGRSQRIVPERTRRLVQHRDGGRCRVPWCDSRIGLEIHHVVHWEDGGATDTSNLVSLCPACHRHHHRGLLHISGDADRTDGLTFTRIPGLHDPPRIRPAAPPGPPPTPDRPYRHPLGERLTHDALTGIFPLPDCVLR